MNIYFTMMTQMKYSREQMSDVLLPLVTDKIAVFSAFADGRQYG